ncbi:MAG: hypothetical protein ACLQM8_27805 [Limisphaerales bacterium]
MKTSILIVLLLLVGVSAFARRIHTWTEAEMQKAAQSIVVGTVADVKDLDETNTVLWPSCRFVGVEATFGVSKVLKGDLINRTVVLHYYRFDPPHFRPPNGPSFLDLKTGDTNRFLLYLVPDGASRFAPVSGQLDPSLDAVRVFRPTFEKRWFACVDGIFTKGEFIDLNTNATERLYIRYGPISDSGVELERTADNVVFWRAHVQPLGVEQSKYRHEVRVRIQDDNILVTSIGAEQIYEVHSLKTGAIISRRVEDVRR